MTVTVQRLCAALLAGIVCAGDALAQVGDPEHSCTSPCCGSDESLDSAKSWSDIARWYRSCPGCDDGCSAEALDAEITHKLATTWDTLTDFEEMIRKEPELGPTILRHLGGDGDPKELRAILRNATLRCPSKQKALCSRIISAARRGLAEQRQAPKAVPKKRPN